MGSTPYSCARSSSSYAARPGSIRYASSIVSSAGSIVSRGKRLEVVRDRARPRRAGARGPAPSSPTMTPSSCASAKRPSRDRERRTAAHLGQLPLTPGDLGALHAHRLRWHRLVEDVDAPEQVAELEAPEHLTQLRAVGRQQHELGRIAVELEIAAHRRELLRLPRLVGVLGDVLASRGRELVGVLDHFLERAVLGDQLAGGLVADAGNARNVVGRVALQPDEVRNLVGADAVARLDAVGRVDLHVRDAARRHHQADVVGDELEGVAVGRDDRRPDARPRRPASRASRSRRRPPSPRTRGCGSRTPRRSGGSTGTARRAGPASACRSAL